ncbi:MAG: hypothetical protein HS115_08120 [Spirochaetales bacterium]|nr:hypothetical protein [Spirochaetales bacterium]
MLKFIIATIWIFITFFVALIVSTFEIIVKFLYKLLIDWRYRIDTTFMDRMRDWFSENRKIAAGWLQRAS